MYSSTHFLHSIRLLTQFTSLGLSESINRQCTCSVPIYDCTWSVRYSLTENVKTASNSLLGKLYLFKDLTSNMEPVPKSYDPVTQLNGILHITKYIRSNMRNDKKLNMSCLQVVKVKPIQNFGHAHLMSHCNHISQKTFLHVRCACLYVLEDYIITKFKISLMSLKSNLLRSA